MPAGIGLVLVLGSIGDLIVTIIGAATGASTSHPPPAVNIAGDIVFDLGFVAAAIYIATLLGPLKPTEFGFRRASLTRVLSRHGLAVEQSRYFDSLGFPAALGVRVMERLGAFRYSPGTVGFYDRALLPISLAGDRLLSGFLGKNVIAVASKRDPGAAATGSRA